MIKTLYQAPSTRQGPLRSRGPLWETLLKRSRHQGHLGVFSLRTGPQKTLNYKGVSLEGAPWRGGLSPAGPSAPGGNRPVAHLQEGRVIGLTEWPGPGVEMRPHQRAQTLPRGPPGPPPPGLA